MGQIEQRLGEVAKLIQSDKDALALRLHMEHVLESPAFSSSRRSGQFLQYVVEKALAQETDALKERTIGIEIFHRAPNYDTGEDAVVRVTASDVRRRLAQHYSGEGQSSEFKISLPPGGYVPEIFRSSTPQWQPPVPVSPEAITDTAEIALPSLQAEQPRQGAIPFNWRAREFSISIAVVLTVLSGLGMWWVHRRSFAGYRDETPWAVLFSAGKPLYVVLSDPDLNEIQLLTRKPVLVSDYANGRLGCESLASGQRDVCSTSLRGDKVAAVDATALARLAALAASYSSNMEPHPARSIRLTDLQGDRNIVFLGSRTANPWVDLFREKLDFYVAHDDASGLQIIHNTHQLAGEQGLYLPTAGPQGTGENYTLITFTHNLSGSGYALLLTGATHEGTDEAASIVTDRQRFEMALQGCNLPSRTSTFQLLVKVKMMAGSALTSEVITCHVL